MFGKVLQQIVDESGGGVGAVLMGYDGIAIEEYFHPVSGVDLQLVTLEYANILKEIRKAAEILDTGEMEEVSIRTDRFHVIIRILNQDYFVALTLAREGNIGKGRYLLLRSAPELREGLT